MGRFVPRFLQPGTGRDSTLWPVLLLLLIVLVPSAGVVWMMRAAMENERLAARQKLADAYRSQLENVHRSIDDLWTKRMSGLERLVEQNPPQRAFKVAALRGVDSVVIFDGDGKVVYPSVARPTSVDLSQSVAFLRAQSLEYGAQDPAAAASAYADIAAKAVDANAAAQARQAQARALLAAGNRAEAIDVLERIRRDKSARDAFGRLIAADAELRLLELFERDSEAWRTVAGDVCRRLYLYDASLPADQRRFIMHEATSLGALTKPHWMRAEDLAAEFVAEPRPPVPPGVIAPTRLADVFQLRSPLGRVIALVERPTLQESLETELAEHPLPQGVVAKVREAGQLNTNGNELAAVSLAPLMPDFRLAADLDDRRSFDAAADKRTVYLLLTGLMVVGLTMALALLVAGMFRRQSRLTRLKNDLVATVSHELKTPLASIRLLVDTMLEAEDNPDSPPVERERAREYLEMISRENGRLTRLIDNFLTFSRMERGKNRFDFRPTDFAAVVDQAIDAVAERFDGVTNTLSVDVCRPLPVDGDADALVTVVVNLLDNAWKYSDSPKKIAVAARRTGDRAVLTVTDNGIGLSPRAARRVFDRFYQVDQHLSRSHDGCGLGLSIVRYIVEAHGGQVTVESMLGAGSKFTISLPADVAASNRLEKLVQAHS